MRRSNRATLVRLEVITEEINSLHRPNIENIDFPTLFALDEVIFFFGGGGPYIW
jgi:hypothetical protein